MQDEKLVLPIVSFSLLISTPFFGDDQEK